MWASSRAKMRVVTARGVYLIVMITTLQCFPIQQGKVSGIGSIWQRTFLCSPRQTPRSNCYTIATLHVEVEEAIKL
jgi:hypothetical protein